MPSSSAMNAFSCSGYECIPIRAHVAVATQHMHCGLSNMDYRIWENICHVALWEILLARVRESVDSLCRDNADAQYMEYSAKQMPYNFTTNILKSLFKRPGIYFECLYDQQDSYKGSKATRKTAKRKSVQSAKFLFIFLFILY